MNQTPPTITSNTGQIVPCDIILRGGSVLDGTGSPALRADIGLRDDRIVAIGDLSHESAGRILDVTGLTVAPGFLDIHTHSDMTVTGEPAQISHIAMGVTTQIAGNCGLSIGLAQNTDLFAWERRALAGSGARLTWDDYDAHLRQIEDVGVATNYLGLAGHGTLRKRIIGLDERPATPDELTAMQRVLEQAMEAGAWGLSSGLEYPPSAYGDVSELAALCHVLRPYSGLYATHMRNEGDTLVESTQEALDVAEAAGVPLQISHHKAEGRANWGKITTTLGLIDAARIRGLDVQMDQYPYTAFMTALGIQTLPQWAMTGSGDDLTARLNDPAQRTRIRQEMLAAHPERDDNGPDAPWAAMQIGVCRARPETQGQTIAALAHAAGQHPLDWTLDLLRETGGYVSAIHFAMTETDIAQVMQHPYTSIGSDGSGTSPSGARAGDRLHPRTYGTFPRILGRYVRELGILTEAQAIHKMTGLPAARLGLADRGILRVGNYADITVYNPATITDCATFDAPHQLAQGIVHVLVNGRFALENGSLTDQRAGRVLRKNR